VPHGAAAAERGEECLPTPYATPEPTIRFPSAAAYSDSTDPDDLHRAIWQALDEAPEPGGTPRITRDANGRVETAWGR
jgi:hypothetical protein